MGVGKTLPRRHRSCDPDRSVVIRKSAKSRSDVRFGGKVAGNALPIMGLAGYAYR